MTLDAAIADVISGATGDESPAHAPLKNQHILITGANGFLGRALVYSLHAQTQLNLQLSACVRNPERQLDIVNLQHCYWDMHSEQLPDLTHIDCIVHSAARVHQLRETAADPLAEFRRVNCAATLALAQAAIAAGVKRFIYISSLHVLGHERDQAYTGADIAAPTDPYAQSKWEAEQGLLALADQIELVILRPPLIYGRQSPGNFGRLVALVNTGVPLPFGAITNRRSLVAVDNLVDLIVRCCWHSAAVGQLFLVADSDALSTPALCAHIARTLGKPSRQLKIPLSILKLGAGLLGKEAIYARLAESLWVDDSATRQRLDWVPPLSTSIALARYLRGPKAP